jgi:hypothetical protein
MFSLSRGGIKVEGVSVAELSNSRRTRFAAANEPDGDLEAKQQQFLRAMQRYERHAGYGRFNFAISVWNVGLQGCLLVLLFALPMAWHGHLLALLFACFIADFINGMVHLYMDHNHNYRSIAGPLIAAFHLHHDTLRYADKPIYKVYFNESGYKVWLAPYLLATMALLHFTATPPFLLGLMIYVGILSSLAEVSHFLCHNSDAPSTRVLQRIGLLVSVKHHERHHQHDNVNYAFLNGWSDPLINWLARRFCSGYSTTTDKHSALYHRHH